MALVRRLVAVALVAALGTSFGMAAEPSGQPRKLTEQLQALSQAAQRNDCPASLPLSRAVIGRSDFATLNEPVRVFLYQIASVCSAEAKDFDAMYRYALAGTQLNGADDRLWDSRLRYELGSKSYALAVATLEALAAKNPERLNNIRVRWLYSLYRDVKEDAALRRPFLAVVTAPAYQPVEALVNGDSFKRDYAGLLVDAGDKAGATALIGRIEEPGVLVDVSLDPRLRTMLPADFDARAAFERRLAQAREIAASHSGSMSAVLDVARYLRQLGRPEEALATLEAASPDGPQAGIFTDLGEQRNWWWDSMASTYQLLGRYDEAVAALRKGVDSKEDGGLNVSQALNLGETQVRFGHPADALATVAGFDVGKKSVSPYGAMVLTLVRGCAHVALDQAEAAKADLAYAETHQRDHHEVYMDLLLCAGRMDAAAAAAIRRLDDPDQRAEALSQFSDYDPPPAGYPQQPFEARLPELKARPDVQAAIARAGGTRRFHLQF